MVDATLTSPEAPDSPALGPESMEGVSQELPEEYRPYSMIDWEQIPEESRPAILEGVKKFQGNMTRTQQELAELKQQLPEYQRQAQLLEQLVNEPWVREAWKRQQSGEPAPSATPPEPAVNLTDYLDRDAATAIDKLVEAKLQERLGPLSNQIQQVQQGQTQMEAKAEIAALSQEAAQKGWPDPLKLMGDMYRIVSEGRAGNVRDAYWLCARDGILEHTTDAARRSITEELKGKAERTAPVAPRVSGTPGQQSFTGNGAVLEALRASAKEIASQTGR